MQVHVCTPDTKPAARSAPNPSPPCLPYKDVAKLHVHVPQPSILWYVYTVLVCV